MHREGEKECRTVVGFRFGPDASVVPVDHALNDRQSNACPFEIFLPMQPLEYAEKFARVIHVKSDTIVFHEIDGFVVVDLCPDFNDRSIPHSRVLEGVVDQVQPDLLEKCRIARARRKIGVDTELRGTASGHLRNTLVNECFNRNGRLLQWVPCEPREDEQVVDELPHLFRVAAHLLQVVLSLFGEPVTEVLEQNPREPVNRSKWCSQVVRNGLGKSFEFVVGFSELSRSYRNALFEFCVQLPNSLLRQFLVGDIVVHAQKPLG